EEIGGDRWTGRRSGDRAGVRPLAAGRRPCDGASDAAARRLEARQRGQPPERTDGAARLGCSRSGAADRGAGVVPGHQRRPPAPRQGGDHRRLPGVARAPRRLHRGMVGPVAGAVAARRARLVRLGEGSRRRGGRAGLVAAPRHRGSGLSVSVRYESPQAWSTGADPAYEALSQAIVAASPVSLLGRSVLDLGAGTGATSRALEAARSRPLALDASAAMLAHRRAIRPPAVLGDMTTLPLATASVGGAIAAFSLSHVEDPSAVLAEARRVTAAGGPVIVGVFA